MNIWEATLLIHKAWIIGIYAQGTWGRTIWCSIRNVMGYLRWVTLQSWPASFILNITKPNVKHKQCHNCLYQYSEWTSTVFRLAVCVLKWNCPDINGIHNQIYFRIVKTRCTTIQKPDTYVRFSNSSLA
jgi:hypothetical protein